MKKITLLMTAVCIVAGAAGFTSSAGETAYGYLFQAKNGSNGFVSFDIDAPQTLNIAKRDYGYVHPSAGEYVDGKIYTYRVEFGDFSEIYSNGWAVYDAETYALIQQTEMSTMNRVVDMTYDYTTNTMYALIENRYTTGRVISTNLCAVDMATGQYTVLGSPGELRAIDGYGHDAEDGLITIACDADGQLYAMSHYRYFYKLDKFAVSVEQVAPRHNLGTAEQFQSMTFAADGKLWWAQQHPSYGHFCEIDLTTGIPGGFVDFHTDYEKLNKLGDDSQVTALFFKDKTLRKQSLKAVTELTAVVDSSNVRSVNLSWVLPSQNYAGENAVPSGIKVYRIGTSEPIATLSGTAEEFTDTLAPDGDVIYEVIPFDASGNGFPAFTKTFAGYDRLTEVTDITVGLTGRTVTVSWTAPASTVNNGYADYNAITYNVYRSLTDSLTLVAEGLAATEFTETIDVDGGYCYVIEPVCGGVVGLRAASKQFVLSSPMSIPYFTGFEDDGDGSQWSFINSASNEAKGYGWAIGKKSYVYDGSKTAVATTYGSSNLGDDWLISPPIEFEAADYILDYYGNGSSYDKQSYEIALGTDPFSPASFTQQLYAVQNVLVYDANGANLSGTETKGWQHIEVKFTVAEAGVYHLGIHNSTTTTYANLRIDNLSIVKDPESGIGSVESVSGETVEYYNMQGVRVDNPKAGLYIKRVGGKASKVLVK